MEMQELQRLAAAGESDQVEFKRTTAERSEAAKTACAMLNGLGGFVLIGVSNTSELRGQQISPRTLEEVAQELRQIEPPAFPEIETVKLAGGNDVIALRVSGGGGPYTFRGRAYLRHGPTTTVMPRQQDERLLLERMHAHHRWENQPAYDIGIEHLDHAEITRTIDEAIRRQRMGEPGNRDPHDLLLGLGLIHQGELLNAAVVLFGKTERLLPHYPQCILRMAPGAPGPRQ